MNYHLKCLKALKSGNRWQMPLARRNSQRGERFSLVPNAAEDSSGKIGLPKGSDSDEIMGDGLAEDRI